MYVVPKQSQPKASIKRFGPPAHEPMVRAV